MDRRELNPKANYNECPRVTIFVSKKKTSFNILMLVIPFVEVGDLNLVSSFQH